MIQDFFTFLFYVIGLVAVLYELWKIYNYPVIQEINRKVDKKQEFTSEESFLMFMMVFYFVWEFLGLFSSQWPLFVVIFILSGLNTIFKNRIWSGVDGILTIIIVILMILNKYHLHYTIGDFI